VTHLSKAYGLAGLRGIRARTPGCLRAPTATAVQHNSLAQAAAVAALRDQAFVQRSRRVNDEGMRQLTQGFERLHLEYIPRWAIS
jgi:histidinol-phosphate aminotransferase